MLYFGTDMVIRLSQFGTLLVSRPAGREAYLAAKAYLLGKASDTIDIDFSGTKVIAPSWLDEFLTPLKEEYGSKVKLGPSENQSVLASLATISQNTIDL